MAIKTYWDAVQIREGKPAYNIEMEEAGNWESFLPNQQFNEILIKAIGAVRNNDMDKHRSLWIEGTYGTGKSHAGAVLKHLLCDNVEEIRQWVDEEYREPQNDALKSNVRHILGISGGKDSASLFMGNPSVTSRRPLGDFPSSILLRGFYNPSIC